MLFSGEVEAFCSDLAGRLHINTVVRMSVDKLHDLLFSADTNFLQHLFSQRHFTGESAEGFVNLIPADKSCGSGTCQQAWQKLGDAKRNWTCTESSL